MRIAKEKTPCVAEYLPPKVSGAIQAKVPIPFLANKVDFRIFIVMVTPKSDTLDTPTLMARGFNKTTVCRPR